MFVAFVIAVRIAVVIDASCWTELWSCMTCSGVCLLQCGNQMGNTPLCLYASPDKVRGPNTFNNMKIASNAWLGKSQDFKWGQFEHLKKKLINARPAIAVEHKRLLLEDTMLLQKGDNILLLLSSNHHLVCSGGHKGFTTKMIDSLSIEPMRPECFKTRMYFAMHIMTTSKMVLTLPTKSNICAPR